jgi:hypothetical protein
MGGKDVERSIVTQSILLFWYLLGGTEGNQENFLSAYLGNPLRSNLEHSECEAGVLTIIRSAMFYNMFVRYEALTVVSVKTVCSLVDCYLCQTMVL